MYEESIFAAYIRGDVKIASELESIRFSTDHPDLYLAMNSELSQHSLEVIHEEFHEIMGHLGSQPDCQICKMTKGSMRRIHKTDTPVRETRVAHTFSMDLLTFDTRAEDGSKYLIVLKCMAAKAYRLIPLYLCTDALDAIKTFRKSCL